MRNLNVGLYVIECAAVLFRGKVITSEFVLMRFPHACRYVDFAFIDYRGN